MSSPFSVASFGCGHRTRCGLQTGGGERRRGVRKVLRAEIGLYTAGMSSHSSRSGELFKRPPQPKAPPNSLIAYTDGGARGNPGPSGYGVVIQDQAGHKVAALSDYLGH